ncbi:hypothetical protein OIDMADRAFT_135397 [Oidiodendron maius Zn]|uniref:L-lactate dehydrogenase n=1 Tax=Oidiodendron maius (strain Zn) TaxID=913774 RepID=A0A0C3GTR4_OIDMZ|nr:hypothetical protein OIDMADRAFT_135397 [Oidiodendron maius Zn]
MAPDRILTADEIAKHNSRQSCWVVIDGHAYDVTDFLDQHPGGSAIILRYAGKDATEEYSPVHSPGTIEKELPKDKHLGQVDLMTFLSIRKASKSPLTNATPSGPLPIEMCVNLHDISLAAQKVLPERAWTYYASASEDLHSHRRNLHDWDRILFRPRVLKNVKHVNMHRKILGFESSLPFFIAPAAMAGLGHPDGERCLVRGAKKFNIPYFVSDGSSVSHEDLAQELEREGYGGVLFYQLYAKKKKDLTIQRIHRARQLGYKALIITVDTAVMGIREEDDRYRMRQAFERGEKYIPLCGLAPLTKDDDWVLRGVHNAALDWNDLKWVKEAWGNTGPISIKGILTTEDAKIACEMGFQSIYLSNHGGRQIDSGPSGLRALLEIRRFYPDVFDKCEVLLDGGVRRSRDILKALCLGATGVGLGRPFLYALSAYGTEGVLKVIQILSDELEISMRLLGVTSLDELRPHMVNKLDLDNSIMREIPGFKNSTSKL